MIRESPSQPDPAEHRQEKVRQIIERVLRARDAGSEIDDAQVEAEHPDLMPDLAESLRALRRMERATQPDAKPADAPSGPDPAAEGFACDLAVLSQELVDYEFTERLEYGGQGVVYRAWHRPTKRSVAVKVMLHGPFSSERDRGRFLREIELISRMRHPNIVTLYSTGVVQGRPYYVMEFVEGLPINDFVLLNGLRTREVVSLYLIVCRAVSSAHQRGVIHRDLKPSNILVDESGRPHILDFGFAKYIHQEAAPELSLTGQVVGTMPYMSPEQARGQTDQLDVRTDIYSLGVVLYELLTDALPYSIDGGVDRLRHRILTAEPVRLRQSVPRARSGRPPAASTVDQDLENVVHKALAKDQDRRYQSADAFADDLERYLAGHAVEARAASRLYLIRKTLRRYRLHAVIAGAFVALLAGFALTASVLYLQAKKQRDQARQIAHLAHATLNDVVTAINEEIEPLPGGMRTRDDLNSGVETRLAELESLLESGAGPELDDVLATTYRNQGDILYEKGMQAAAAERYRSFLETGRRLLRDHPHNRAYRRLVSSAHGRLAEAVEDYEPHYRRAIEIETESLSLDPPEADVELVLCDLHRAFGRRLYLEARFDQAAEQLATALSLAESATARNPENHKCKSLLASILALHGKTRLQFADHQEARSRFSRAIGLREELIEEHPANAQFKSALVESYLDLGEAYRLGGQSGRALEQYQRAVQIGRLLVRMDPGEARWTRRLFAALQRLAQELLKSGDLEKAQQVSVEATACAEKLLAFEPSNPEWQRKRAHAYHLHAKVSYAQEAWAAARDHLLAAVTLCQTARETDERNIDALAQLAAIYGLLGKCFNKLEEPAQANDYLRLAYDISSELVTLQPKVPKRRLQLIASQVNLAAWCLRQRSVWHDREAFDLLPAAQENLDHLRDTGYLKADDPRYGSYASAIHKNLALLQRRAGAAPHPERVPEKTDDTSSTESPPR